MPGAKTHTYITEAAVKLLPFEIGNVSKFTEEYCNYPDYYHFDPKRVIAYHFETDGVQFHYPPDVAYNELYRYWGVKDGKICRMKTFVNENFIHTVSGFKWYMENALQRLQKNEPEEAKKFLGCLLHMLEDSFFGLHALEGAGGVDAFAINRLIDSDELPVKPLLSLSCIGLELPDYQPEALGNTVPEAVMNLYAAYCKRSDSSRKCAFRIVMKQLAGQDYAAETRQMFENAVKTCSDVIYTIYKIAENSAGCSGDLPLNALIPFEFPCGGFRNYNLRTIEWNRAFLPDGTKIQLELQSGNGVIPVEEGFSFGSHFEGALRYWIAPDVFRAFTCTIGLHPACEGVGDIKFKIRNDGKIVQEIVLDQELRTQEIRVEHPGNELALEYSSTSSCGIVVVANGIFQR